MSRKYENVALKGGSFAVTSNPLGGFDVTKYLGTEELETVEGVETVEALIEADSGAWGAFVYSLLYAVEIPSRSYLWCSTLAGLLQLAGAVPS